MEVVEKTDYSECIFAGTQDGETYGFYLPDSVIDESTGEIQLKDYVTLTSQEHIALMDGQCEGKRIVFHKGEKPTLEDPEPPTEEQLAKEVRRKRNNLIEEVEWRIQRYQQQSELGSKTTDSEETYKALLLYVQELRDITLQEGFPKEVVFPELKV